MEKNVPVTYMDIANELEIAVSTVSRAINNSGGVSEKTRKAVLAVAERMHYVPNETARNLILKTNNTVAAIIPDIMNPYYAEIIQHLEAVFRANNYAFLLCITNESDTMMDYYLNELLKKRVGGIILLSSFIKNTELYERVRRNTVLVGVSTSHDDIDQVACKEELGTYNAIHHLVELGHRRIGFIGYRLSENTVLTERLKGYKRALHEAGIPFDNDLVVESEPIGHPGQSEVSRLLQLKKKPTAIHCMNEYIAIGAYSALQDKGLRVPEDISFSAQDGLYVAKAISPNLTTIVTPIIRMAEVAAELLLDRIANGMQEEVETVLFNNRFRPGITTAELDTSSQEEM